MNVLNESISAMASRTPKEAVLALVDERLSHCPYSYVFNRVVVRFDDGRLILRGSVPSFYLKQMLQEQLRGIEHVEKMDNEVDVVCAHGLSSVKR